MKNFILLSILMSSAAFNSEAQYFTIWKTDNAGTSASNQISIPATGTNYTINWVEVGNPDNSGTATGTDYYTLTFPSPGTYQVSITKGNGSFDRIEFDDEDDKLKLLQITQWGDTPWTSMEEAYYGCANLTVTASDIPNLQYVTDMTSMFDGCTALNTVPDIRDWDVHTVTNMRYMFYDAIKFNEFIGYWDVSQVTDMVGMFWGATAFNESIEQWDVSSVNNMNSMFSEAISFNQFIGNWDVSNVTDMGAMFEGATTFNQSIEKWEVGNVRFMDAMFSRATAFNKPIGGWVVSNVENMSEMFHYAQAFDQTIENWDVGKVLNMRGMFYEATAFNQNIENLNVNNVTDMSNMFRNATAFNKPIEKWKTANVTDMSGMFHGAKTFNQPVHNLKVGNVVDMSNMFNGATAFNHPIDYWNDLRVTNMDSMFYKASAFNQPIGELRVGNVTNMTRMLARATAFNQPVGRLNLVNVTNMSSMFDSSGIDCQNLTLSLQGWANNSQISNNITFGAYGLDYGSEANAALTTLRTTKNWTITIGDEVDCAALDVSLISFLAMQENGKVNLQWATASETDHDYFELERSADARKWVALTKLKGAGTVTTVQQYAATDLNPFTGTSYYRLKIVDLAGKAEYSNIRSVHITTPQIQYTYPNPAYTTITLTGTPMGTLKIYNILGQEVMQKTVLSEKTEINIQKLPVGVYTLKMNNGWNTRFVKQ